jgi:hypothetical protein
MQTLAPTWNLGDTATPQWYVRLFPSLNDVAFLVPMVALFASMKGTQLLFADGDTGWHIRTGEWILAHHRVPTTDLFSFTKANKPWFAWEWGWDVVFGLIHRYTGLAGVGFVTTLMLGVFALLVYRLALRISNNNVMSMLVTALAAGLSSIHWLARPHLVSWIFMLIFLSEVETARHNGRRRLLYLLPILMVLWVNLHAGFIAGLLILVCYAVGEALTVMAGASHLAARQALPAAWQRTSLYWKSLGLCAIATFVNPYGWQLHVHIFKYLTDARLLDKIQEFQSISFHAGPAALFEIMLLLAAFVVFDRLTKLDFAPLLLICLWAHFALLSARHIPLFAIAAAPFVAELLARALSSARTIPVAKAAAEVMTDICRDIHAMELTPRLHLASGAAVLVIAGLFAAGLPPFAAEFNPETFPLQAMPVIQRYTGARIFTTDQWADYLIYRLYPAQRVFFDGRSDFYGYDFVRVNQRITSADHDWKSLLASYGIQLVVLQPDTPLVAVLKLTPESRLLFDDGKVIVFDTSSISQKFGAHRETANRAASLPFPQRATQAVAFTANHPNTFQKGRT